MPNFDYSKIYDVAERLLDKFGSTGTLSRYTDVITDTTKPWVKTQTKVDHTVKMVILPLTDRDRRRYFGQDLINAENKAIILWNASINFKVDDIIAYQSKSYTMYAFNPIKPVSTGIIYVCALSGGH